MKKFASDSILAYQSSLCGGNFKSRYELLHVGNYDDGNADTLVTAGSAEMLSNMLTLPYEVSPQILDHWD